MSNGHKEKPDDTTNAGGVQALVLNTQHMTMLHDESGISDQVIWARGYRTIMDKADLEALGFAPNQRRVPGLLLPLHTTDGGNSAYVYRPDDPRVIEERRRGKRADGTYPCRVIKYEVPKGAGTRVDCPPICQPTLANPSIPLWVTEGQKKADALASRGLCAIALLGVWNWRGRNQWGGTTFLADFDYIALKGRDVRLVFDSDVMAKADVRQALERFTEHLQRKGAHVGTVYLPPGPDGSKAGVDDWLAGGHTAQELEALLEAPRPEPQPAAPVVELLDAPPPAIRRPLALVDGRAYAAAWLPVRVTITEGLGRKGEVVKYNPPEIITETRCFIVRDDGVIFGDGGDKPMGRLGMEVVLPEIPRPERTWSTAGVKGYRTTRPNPAEVFGRVVDVIDRFIDFSRSLADQRVVAEMVGCYVLATYYTPALNVIGYLWPNGDRGSGKTVLLHVVTSMAYLGQVILAGGSYASLRDLADYGATLAFDDAENISDSRQSDPDKRSLLLAGNRRGSTVTVKEPGPDKTWRTRHIDAFCPRAFSAIKLPDNVLASRTIVIPLIRTPDRSRANADPLDYETWPHDRRELINDLWALALEHLPSFQEQDRAVGEEASLTGRNLEPWRAILAVARWLDGRGVSGLWERMNALSVAYQSERPDLETSDLTALVIRALCHCATNATSATSGEIPAHFDFKTAQVKEEAHAIAEEDDSYKPEYVTSSRVGRALARMRLEKVPRPGGRGSRIWRVTPGDLERWTVTYGLKPPEFLDTGGTEAVEGAANDDADLLEGEL